MTRLRILYVSRCEPRSDGSGSQQRSAVAVDALSALGDVYWLEGPPESDDSAETTARDTVPGGICKVLSARSILQSAPLAWRSFVRPSRMRVLFSDSWVTAGRVCPPSKVESAELVGQITRCFGNERFDIIFAFQAQSGAFVEQVVDRLLKPTGLFVVDWDAAERPGVAALSLARPGGKTASAAFRRFWNDVKLRRVERRLLNRAGLTLCASHYDVAYFRHAAGHDRVACFTNCVRLPQPAARVNETPGYNVLFVGLINYWPNEQGLLDFLERIWPTVKRELPDSVFRIVGRGCTPAVAAYDGREAVQVVGVVEDVAAHYAWCDVAVAPMTFSVGSSIKVLEALAYRRPLVAYEASARRHDLRRAIDVHVAVDADSFAFQVIKILQDPRAAQCSASIGFERVKQLYDRTQIVFGLTETVGSVFERRNM